MPQLKIYDAGDPKLTPTDRGTDANLQAARRTGAFYNEAAGLISAGAQSEVAASNDLTRGIEDAAGTFKIAGKLVDDYLGHQEVSKGAAASATLFSQLNDQWNDTVKKADPNDPSVAAKFREEVLEPSLQKFNDAYSNTERGRNWTESHVASMRNHFFQKTASDMSTLAGAAIEQNVRQLGNQSAASALKSPDFHTADYLLNQVPESVGAIVDSSPNVKGADASRARTKLTEKMSEQIVVSGAIGAVARSNDPEGTAQAWADRYPQYISPADAKTLASNAKQQTRAQRQDETYQRHLEDVAAKRRSDAAETGILQQLYSDDPAEMNKVNSRSIVNNPNLSREAKERTIRLVDREMKPESDAKVSARNSQELFARIYLPADDPNKINDTGPIIQARVDGKITKADFHELRTEVTNARTPDGEKLGTARTEFMKRWAPMIDGAMTDVGTHSLLGTQKTYQFMMDARAQENDLRKKGLDPSLVYDPRSEYFVGKPENIAKYHVTLQEAQNYKATFKEMSDALAKKRGNLSDEPSPTGVETIPQKPGERTFVPPSNWQFSASRQQYRDPSGKLYDAAGNPVK